MLATLRNALKVKDLRQRLFFTFMMLLVIRLGSQLPCPGVDRTYFSSWFAKQSAEAFNFFNAFTGGSFEQMSILALSITPYITSSIIIQLLTIAIPQLEEMQRDGEDGRKKLTAITRYVTVGLALIEGTAMAIGFGNQGLIPAMSSSSATFITKAGAVITVVAALTAGSTFLMWIGERITEKGVGNGTSIVLMINILSRIPSDMNSLFEMFVFKDGQTVAKGALAAVGSSLLYSGNNRSGYCPDDATRKIPVQYSKKMQGRKMVGGQQLHSSESQYCRRYSGHLRIFPDVHAHHGCFLYGKNRRHRNRQQDYHPAESGSWFNLNQPVYTLGFVLYVVLNVFFCLLIPPLPSIRLR